MREMPQEDETVGQGGNQAPPEGDIFTQFSEATDLDVIISSFQVLCREAQVDEDGYERVYPSLKTRFTAWKPCSVWELLDARAALPEYGAGGVCRGRRVLVVGAGPVGLRIGGGSGAARGQGGSGGETEQPLAEQLAAPVAVSHRRPPQPRSEEVLRKVRHRLLGSHLYVVSYIYVVEYCWYRKKHCGIDGNLQH